MRVAGTALSIVGLAGVLTLPIGNDARLTAEAALQPASTGRPRLFPPQDLGLLETPDREQWQKPDVIMDKLKIADGDTVADLGAGGGWFTIRLADRVGSSGTVYAGDIQPQMLAAVERRLERENVRNVSTVLATATDPRLPMNLDAVLIVDAYSEMDDPSNPDVIVTFLSNVRRSLDPQGCLGIVDFLSGGGGPGPDPEERVDPESIVGAATKAGLDLLARETVPPFMYLLVFGQRTSRCAAAP